MIEALLHGKLSREQANMEDILTSNVFGMLQYVAPELGLFPFLARAKTAAGGHPLESLVAANDSGQARVQYDFWPKWPRCEPDVVLHIRRDAGSSYLVGIEAKFRSGKSSEADEIEERPNDQLAREWADLDHQADERGAQPVLVYLTTDVSCPKLEIQESLEEVRRKSVCGGREPTICWLSWRQLPRLFHVEGHDPGSPILADVARMAERMGLVFFERIERVATVRAGWSFQPRRFQVAPISCQWRFAP
jgi:hypothetical protein